MIDLTGRKILPGTGGQNSRILRRFLQSPDMWIAMPDLSRAGSGKPDGWCSSFTRRIKDLRECGYVIEQKEEREGKVVHSFYRIIWQSDVEAA